MAAILSAFPRGGGGKINYLGKMSAKSVLCCFVLTVCVTLWI